MATSAPDISSARSLLARIDRINVWSLSFVFIGIIGTGFLFTFYDIFDINVSFIQTCTQLRAGCTPENALNSLSLPVVLNMVGYVVGTLALSPLSDRFGRRNMLLITMLVTGIGSLYTAVAPDYPNFILARVLTGIGIGADLAAVSTYISEVAPRRGRAKYTAVIFTMSAVGAFLGIWLGLLLTTPKTPWPQGLPFAQASTTFTDGWRWMYGIGAVLALIGILMRVELPESPRWLIGRGRLTEAESVVTSMERRALRHGPLAEPTPVPSSELSVDTSVTSSTTAAAFVELFRNPLYVRRILILLAMWLTAYITVYGFANGLTSVLTGLHFPPPEAGIITAMGTIGFILQGPFAALFVERLERRYWLPIGGAITLIGSILLAEAGTTLAVAFVGAGLIFFGFNVWVSPTYALSAEAFPTRARSTGFALVDGVGHIGGGIGVLVIANHVGSMSVLGALLLISAFQIVAAIIAQFTPHTRGRDLDRVSP